MSDLKKIEDLQDFAKYKADLVKSLARIRKVPVVVTYVKRFQFKTKAAPLALVGAVDSGLKAALVGQKVEMKVGKCVRRDDGKLVLDALNAFQLQEVLKGAAAPEEIDANGDFKKTGLGSLAETVDKLDKHMKDSGRATSDQAKREEAAAKILEGMEDSTNKRNAKVSPGKAPAHHVSAHGPGTDQISRLVAGRRSDEVHDEQAQGKTPVAKVKLTGNPDGIADTEVPVYDKVGQNPSNVAGSFKTNVAMLQALEEAYAQVTQLDAHLAALEKDAFAKNYEKALAVPAVSAALLKVQAARKSAQAAKVGLKKPGLNGPQVQLLTEHVKKLEATATAAADDFQKELKANGGTDPIPRPPEMAVGDKRFVRNVTPGSPTAEGIGQGVVIEDSSPVGKQKAKASIADGVKTAEQVMQERFEEIKLTGPQQKATVVMDPAYVQDDKGVKRRAGWDVQTAFPNDDPGQKPLQDPAVAEEFVKLSRIVADLEGQLEAARARKDGATVKYDAAKKKADAHAGAIKAKEDKGLDGLKKGLAAAKTKGNPEGPILLKIKALEDEIDAMKLALPGLRADELNEKNAADLLVNAAVVEIAKLEGELTTARENVDKASKA